jgi:hypothetical protein
VAASLRGGAWPPLRPLLPLATHAGSRSQRRFDAWRPSPHMYLGGLVDTQPPVAPRPCRPNRSVVRNNPSTVYRRRAGQRGHPAQHGLRERIHAAPRWSFTAARTGHQRPGRCVPAGSNRPPGADDGSTSRRGPNPEPRRHLNGGATARSSFGALRSRLYAPESRRALAGLVSTPARAGRVPRRSGRGGAVAQSVGQRRIAGARGRPICAHAGSVCFLLS